MSRVSDAELSLYYDLGNPLVRRLVQEIATLREELRLERAERGKALSMLERAAEAWGAERAVYAQALEAAAKRG